MQYETSDQKESGYYHQSEQQPDYLTAGGSWVSTDAATETEAGDYDSDDPKGKRRMKISSTLPDTPKTKRQVIMPDDTPQTCIRDENEWLGHTSVLPDPDVDTGEPKVPGCKAGGDSKAWTVTSTMLQTYNVMRGSRTDVVDPLGHWIGTKVAESMDAADHEGKPADPDARTLCEYTREIGEAQMERPLIIQEKRVEVAKVPRAPIEHLVPPQGYDPSAFEEVTAILQARGNFCDEYDISDDEGDPMDGRISPCTYLAWAEGSKRWNNPDQDMRVEMPKDVSDPRLSPFSPPLPN